MYARYIPPPKGAVASPKPKRTHESSASPAKTSRDAMTIKPGTVQAAATVATNDGFGYSRYVPQAQAQPVKETGIQYFDDGNDLPPPAKRLKETKDDTRELGSKKKTKEELASRNGAPTGSEEPRKKKKNRRKRKQRTRGNDDDDDEDKGDDDGDQNTHQSTKAPQKPLTEKSESEGEDARDEKPEDIPAEDPMEVDVVTTGVTIASKEAPIPAKTKRKRTKEKRKADKMSGDGVPPAEDEEEDASRHKTVLERKTKSLTLASKISQNVAPEAEEEPTEARELEPLPQPAVVPDNEAKPTYETLPPWLSKPIRVSQATRSTFAELGIQARPARYLADKGFSEALAVQTAAIPLLLPNNKHLPGDVLISAVTGSGKTLAYALPIVRDLGQGLTTRLRALVVLPTRELVKQAQEVFELCARAYDFEDRKRVRIGIAVGHQCIKSERDSLIRSESRYDPDTYKALEEEEARLRKEGGDDATEDELFLEKKNPRFGQWEGEVVDFYSKVDVLICTPGRLREHAEQTTGFSLDNVRWLVVDEADKLLAQSFQGWLGLVMERLKRTSERFGARDFPDMQLTGPRKVVVSATLTRDLSLLGQLELRRPQLVVLEEEEEGEKNGASQVAEHQLPQSLREFAVRVHESSLKPLYLLDLLRSRDMAEALGKVEEPMPNVIQEKKDEGRNPDADSDSDSNSDSATSDSSTDSSSSDSDTSSSSSDDDSDAGEPRRKDSHPPLPQALIFTKSNESALRLGRLLEILEPSLAPRMRTVTSSTPTHIRRKTLRAFAQASAQATSSSSSSSTSSVQLVVASDLVARGIDIPRLAHVINYDLPPSVPGYVHRVGRTARAGRPGCAWTLLADEESGWFWGRIAKGRGVRRAQGVERTRIAEMTEERVRVYEEGLAVLGREASERKRGGRGQEASHGRS